MERCPKCRCDLRVGEVSQEEEVLHYKLICVNPSCPNCKKVVRETEKKDR